MIKKLKRVNDFLNNSNNSDNQNEINVVLDGTNALSNILISETVKLSKLEQVSNQLINYLTDSKQLSKLTHKEKQSLLMDISEVQNNSRDFIFKVAELAAKNKFLQEVLQLNNKQNHIETSINGECYISSIDDSTRRHLTELLRTIVIDEKIQD